MERSACGGIDLVISTENRVRSVLLLRKLNLEREIKMKRLLILAALMLSACAPENKDGANALPSIPSCSKRVESETRAIIDRNGWNPSPSLVAGIVADAEQDNACKFSVFYPPCSHAVASEYATITNAVPRPMTTDQSDYYWNEIQDRYSCVMPSFIFQQN
jgi:hypothetical protein